MKQFRFLSILIALVIMFTSACQPAATPAPVEPAAPAATEAPAAPAAPTGEIRIGVLAPTTGAFAGLGEDVVAGAKMKLEELGNEIAGRPVKLFVEDTQLDPDMAIEKARALVNRDKVSIILGPLSGGESLAVKQAAGEFPNTTILTIGAANEITMKEIAPNVYRPAFAGGQPVYALAEWAMKNGITRIATLGEDYAFPWDQIGGFAYVYCKLGGTIAKAYWTPIGTADYSSILTELPNLDVDAVFIAYGGSDAVNFTKQMNDFGLIGKVKILAGSSFGDASTLNEVGELLDGTMSGSIYSGNLPYDEFKKFNTDFEAKFGRQSTLFAEGTYEATTFVEEAAKAVNGNIEDQAAFRAALDKTEIMAPRGPVKFDQYHNVIANMYLNRVEMIDGKWINNLVETIPDVTQYWTFTPDEFNAALPFGRDNPKCPVPVVPAEPAAPPAATGELRIGVLAPTTGAFAGLGEDMVAGVKMRLEELGGKVAGREVKLFVEDTQLDPDVAIEKARALVNRDKVSVVLGPLSGGESLAVKQAAGEFPDTTFLTIGAANEITMKEIAPNFYRPAFAGGQPVYGLAEWALANGIKRIATLGEDYAFPWDQVGGFAYVYCKQGGKIPKAYWTPIGTADYSSILTELPSLDVDAVFIAYGGSDAVNFTKQMNDFGLIGKVKILAGSSFGDASTLNEVGELLDGTMSGSIYSGNLPFPEFKAFNDSFFKMTGRQSTLFAEGTYEALTFVDEAGKAVNGNIEDQTAFRAALDKTEVNTPRGPVKFDQYHNVIANMYRNQVTLVDGIWINNLVETYPNVSQYWTYTPEEFDAALPFGRDNPSCP